MLKLTNISLQFPYQNHPTLKNIDFHVTKNDFVILLGGNGSGKSSLLKLLYKQYQRTSGEIIFLDKSIDQYTTKELYKKIAVLTQDCADSLFYSLTLYENYLLMRHAHPQDKKYLENYLLEFNPNLATKLHLTVEQLSGGEKQALALAMCFLKEPKLLLLDEHTSALDPKTSQQIMALTQRMINKHQISCIMTTHDLNLATQYGNRILMLREGSIYKTMDKEKEMLSQNQLMGAYG